MMTSLCYPRVTLRLHQLNHPEALGEPSTLVLDLRAYPARPQALSAQLEATSVVEALVNDLCPRVGQSGVGGQVVRLRRRSW